MPGLSPHSGVVLGAGLRCVDRVGARFGTSETPSVRGLGAESSLGEALSVRSMTLEGVGTGPVASAVAGNGADFEVDGFVVGVVVGGSRFSTGSKKSRIEDAVEFS